MSEELKPCPFCGKAPHDFGYGEKYYTIECQSDDCLVNVSADTVTKAEAIKAWNTRADNALIDTLVEAMGFYFKHYMLDEALDEEGCVCGSEQHEAAKRVQQALAEAKKWKGEA